MSLKQSVRRSLRDYADARVRRREVLGPDLIDTISEIGSATTQAGIEITKQIGDNFKSVYTNLKDKWNEYTTKLKEQVSQIRGGLSDTKNKMAERISVPKRTGRSKHSFADRVRRGVKGFRDAVANRLERVALVLKGYSEGERVTSDIPEIQNHPQPTHISTDESQKIVNNIESTNKKKTVDIMQDDNLRKDFIRYYATNEDYLHPIFDKLDNQKPEPSLGDYMMASGFSTFIAELRGSDKLDNIDLAQDGLGTLRPLVEQMNEISDVYKEIYGAKQGNIKDTYKVNFQESGQITNNSQQTTVDDVQEAPYELDESVGTKIDEINEVIDLPNVELTEDDLFEFQGLEGYER